MAQVKLMFKPSTVDLSQECLFELKCLIKANNIHHAAQSEIYQKRFLAFAYGSSDLGLYYLRDSVSLPIIKKVPWFQNSRKKIACLCFDPFGSWLLVASIDGSFYIIPVKTLINETYSSDQKWTTKDITTYSSLNAQNSFARYLNNYL
jgi:WD40 repeat protein